MMQLFLRSGIGLIVLMFSLGIVAGVATAKPVPVEYFAQLPAIKDAALSPNGKSLAAIVEQDGNYVVATFDLTPKGLGNPHTFKLHQNGKLYSVGWANNKTVLFNVGIYEVVDRTLYMSHWLYSASKDLKDADSLLRPITAAGSWALDYSDVVSMLWDDPDHIMMQFMDNQRSMESVYKIHVRTGEYERLLRGSKDYRSWIADRQGRVRIGWGGRRKGKDQSVIKVKLKLRQAGAKVWEKQDQHPTLSGDIYIYGFDADPDIIYVGLYKGRDTRGLYTYNLKTKTLGSTIYHEDGHDVGGIMTSADHKRVVGYYYADDENHAIYFDAKAKERNAILERKFADFDVVTYDETPDGEWAVLKVTAPDYPSEMILYNYKTNKSTALSKMYPKLTEMDIGPVKFVKYKARDDTKIPAYVTLPPKFFDGAKLENLPFVIYPHGGPGSRNYKGFDYRAQLIASRGYGVLQMNFRGSSGYGKAYKDAGRKDWQVMQNDIVDGVKWLIDKGYADKDRICIVGGSYGGYAAVISAINNPNMFACAASYAGVMDVPRLVDDGVANGGRSGIKYSISSGFKNRAEMREQSPTRRAEELKIPLLIAHGERDLVVGYRHQFKIMKTALKKSKAKVTYLSLPEADHYLSRGVDRLSYHKALDDFLRENLGDSAVAP